MPMTEEDFFALQAAMNQWRLGNGLPELGQGSPAAQAMRRNKLSQMFPDLAVPQASGEITLPMGAVQPGAGPQRTPFDMLRRSRHDYYDPTMAALQSAPAAGITDPRLVAALDQWKAGQAGVGSQQGATAPSAGYMPQTIEDVRQHRLNPAGLSPISDQNGYSPSLTGPNGPAMDAEWRRGLRSSTGQPLTMAPNVLPVRKETFAGPAPMPLLEAQQRQKMRETMRDLVDPQAPTFNDAAKLAREKYRWQLAEAGVLGDAAEVPLLTATSATPPGGFKKEVRRLMLAAARQGNEPLAAALNAAEAGGRVSDPTRAYAEQMARSTLKVQEAAERRRTARELRMRGPGPLMVQMMKQGTAGGGAGGEGGLPKGWIDPRLAATPQQAAAINAHNGNLGQLQIAADERRARELEGQGRNDFQNRQLRAQLYATVAAGNPNLKPDQINQQVDAAMGQVGQVVIPPAGPPVNPEVRAKARLPWLQRTFDMGPGLRAAGILPDAGVPEINDVPDRLVRQMQQRAASGDGRAQAWLEEYARRQAEMAQ